MPCPRHFPLVCTQGWQAGTAWALKHFPAPKSQDRMTTVKLAVEPEVLWTLNNLEGHFLHQSFHVYGLECCEIFSLVSFPSKVSTALSRKDKVWASGNNKLEHNFLQVWNWRCSHLRSQVGVTFQHLGVEEEGQAKASAEAGSSSPQVNLLTHWLSFTRCVSRSRSLHRIPDLELPCLQTSVRNMLRDWMTAFLQPEHYPQLLVCGHMVVSFLQERDT